MKNVIVGFLAALICLLAFSGCGGGAGSSDGTVTVNFTDGTTVNDEYLYGYAYAHGETDLDSAANVVACGYEQIAGGVCNFTFMVDDGAWMPTAVEWTGSGGVTYDLYIYTDDSGNNPTGEDYMTNPIPIEVTISGDQDVDIDFDDMVAYDDSGF